MNDFLNSVKDDLLDVRLRLVVLLLGIALVAAVAFAVLGGGSSGSTVGASAAPVASGVAGISISQAPSSTEPVTETTNGAVQQRHGPLHDPFTPLPSATTKAAAPATSSSSSSSSSSASGGSSTSGSKTSTPAPAPAPKATGPEKTKVTTRFEVTVQFGVLPAPSIEGTPTAPAPLKTYADIRLNEPLPDKTNPQLVFVGALKSTYLEAVFTLTGESILHGSATCVPSTTQCQAIRLQVGQTETLESVDSSGAPVTYELRVLSIVRITKTARVASAHGASLDAGSKAGLELLQREGLSTLSGLEYSPAKGLLVPTAPASAAPRAHVALRRPRHGR
jgi:hypothetical protein